MKIMLLLALSLATAPALAADSPKTDTPADYSHALSLQVSGKQGVVGVRLPQAVYLNARTASLDDVRVFDAKGVVQPYALHRPPTATAAQRTTRAANVFPVRAKDRQSTGTPSIDIDIQTRPDGSVMSVQAHAGKSTTDDAVLDSLILDFGPMDNGSETALASTSARIEALRFSTPKDQPNYTAQVWLETSNDLKKWSAIGAAELGWLSNDSAQTLANDRLEFSPQAFRYARLTWRRGEPALFSSIQADVVIRQSAEPFRETLWLKPVPGIQTGDLVYKAGIAVPVEQISLKLSEPNIVYPVTLGAYVERPSRQAGKTTEWVFQPRTQATFYQISQDGEARRSGALTINPVHQKDWVIRPLNGATTAQPELGLAWQPATLIFLAGGTPPYSLRFGRSDANPASQPLSRVAPGFSLNELNTLESAQVGALQSSNSSTAGASAAAEAGLSARNRTFILWGVLLLGVVVLGGMAWRLVRQMSPAPPKDGDAG